MTSLWPENLRLDINPVGIGTIDIQKWIHTNHAPVSRIKCASEQDNRDFIDLVESLRNCGGVGLRKVSANSPSHAVTVRDCRVGGPDATSPRAAFHGPALCGVSRERHPEATPIPRPRPYEAPCGFELLDVVWINAFARP